jgi:hypothetical protein
MVRMAWVFGAVIAVLLGLHIGPAASAKREITKRIQPFLDDLFGSHPKQSDQIKARSSDEARR